MRVLCHIVSNAFVKSNEKTRTYGFVDSERAISAAVVEPVGFISFWSAAQDSTFGAPDRRDWGIEKIANFGGLRFYRDSSSSSMFFLYTSCPPNSLSGTQQKPATCSEMSAIWKCMSEIWVSSPRKIGGPKPPFSTTSQLNGNSNWLCLRNDAWDT